MQDEQSMVPAFPSDAKCDKRLHKGLGTKIAHLLPDAFGENAMGRKAADIIDMLTEDHDRLLVLFLSLIHI